MLDSSLQGLQYASMDKHGTVKLCPWIETISLLKDVKRKAKTRQIVCFNMSKVLLKHRYERHGVVAVASFLLRHIRQVVVKLKKKSVAT